MFAGRNVASKHGANLFSLSTFLSLEITMTINGKDVFVFMNVAGKKYVAEIPQASGDSMLPVCTQELFDILVAVERPLNDEEIETCRVALATHVPSTNEQTQENDNVA